MNFKPKHLTKHSKVEELKTTDKKDTSIKPIPANRTKSEQTKSKIDEKTKYRTPKLSNRKMWRAKEWAPVWMGKLFALLIRQICMTFWLLSWNSNKWSHFSVYLMFRLNFGCFTNFKSRNHSKHINPFGFRTRFILIFLAKIVIICWIYIEFFCKFSKLNACRLAAQ